MPCTTGCLPPTGRAYEPCDAAAAVAAAIQQDGQTLVLTLPEGEEPQARPFPSRTNRVLPRTLNAENEDALRVHANLKSRLEAASAANTGLTSTSFHCRRP